VFVSSDFSVVSQKCLFISAACCTLVVFAASRGFLYGSQFCYLIVSMMMSREDASRGLFGPFSSQSSKLVLIGASHK